MLKMHAEPVLHSVMPQSAGGSVARRLLKLLQHFPVLSVSATPSQSIARDFIPM